MDNICRKADERSVRLAKLLPNIGGSSDAKRRVMASAHASIILYAAPIWSEAVQIKNIDGG